MPLERIDVGGDPLQILTNISGPVSLDDYMTPEAETAVASLCPDTARRTESLLNLRLIRWPWVIALCQLRDPTHWQFLGTR